MGIHLVVGIETILSEILHSLDREWTIFTDVSEAR